MSLVKGISKESPE